MGRYHGKQSYSTGNDLWVRFLYCKRLMARYVYYRRNDLVNSNMFSRFFQKQGYDYGKDLLQLWASNGKLMDIFNETPSSSQPFSRSANIRKQSATRQLSNEQQVK